MSHKFWLKKAKKVLKDFLLNMYRLECSKPFPHWKCTWGRGQRCRFGNKE